MVNLNKKLILLELNEINFDYVKKYIEAGERLNSFRKIIDNGLFDTSSESEYSNLEPWIQWPSVHTGLSYSEHGIFRLGDCVNFQTKQFFEHIESAGYTVGAISPMNARNNLKKPSYFIPDPWTKTPSDGSFLSESISLAVSQAVNDNSSSKITAGSILRLCIAFVALVRPSKFLFFISYVLKSLRKPWRKALFLDMLLYEIHRTLLLKKNAHFSTLFLNAGAHIQHHYFFNSPFTSSDLQNPKWYIGHAEDPLLEMLKIYDAMLEDLFLIDGYELIIATGLSQIPYGKAKFYYRLSDHKSFLEMLGIEFIDVLPRMTRDFLINFDSKKSADAAHKKLREILVNNSEPLFREIDHRGESLFITLTFPYEITEDTTINFQNELIPLDLHVSFVAIKNGEHQAKGFSFFSKGVSKYAPQAGRHVSRIHGSILDFFGVS